MSKKYSAKVIDFFCGAGGFSEGFRQEGFDIVMGVDYWQPAIDSHNLNHHLNDSVKDVLDFWGKDSSDVSEINAIPNTGVIIGSPACVSFSMSNKAGKADKTLGVRLIESFLRIVAVKKHQKNSVLCAWYMENVPQSANFVKSQYSFKDLNLSRWAEVQGISQNSPALIIKGEVLNAGDFGAPQSRKRFIVGEWVESGEFLTPIATHQTHVTVKKIREQMPPVNVQRDSQERWRDPNYPELTLMTSQITDHFYDTGLYEVEWEKAQHLKINHPFMGKMSFPENENKTCRTVLATRSAATREALIYKSEFNRTGNGEYRLPTIREIASLMGYPYCYQFVGSEATKWRQVGNSVSPHLSAALARVVRMKMNLPAIEQKDFSSFDGLHEKVVNLNTFTEKAFLKPKTRSRNARFRRHPLKAGNMTVDLMNFHPDKTKEVGKMWYVTAYTGTGMGHGIKTFNKRELSAIENMLDKVFGEFHCFKQKIQKEFYKVEGLQNIFEEDLNFKNPLNPVIKVKELATLIRSYDTNTSIVDGGDLFPKQQVPLSQMMAAYALLCMVS